ncbi:universal stress protein [Tessaracoccus antarcticus]|uniref:Universal stress protein n=1 Tax=Tessaracoccus antarcticus TaxID=2479848 RepID=A0A3M0GAH2_9ACTN|nr:universal stress protein [Tessaracoccus antarcticus]RMB61970.1 universal stress protein [Tessaracoccus antarcticus]
MDVLVWIAEGTWQACVEAVALHVPPGSAVTFLHVAEPAPRELARGAGSGLLGAPRRRSRDRVVPETDLAEQLGRELLERAAGRVGAPVSLLQRRGRVEREVVAEAAGKDLLILARDGDRRRLGPRSLAPATRFVLDHAPCTTLLVWPEPAPHLSSIPPPPAHPPQRPS